MDTMNEIKSERLEALLLDEHYRDKVKNIDLKLYSNAGGCPYAPGAKGNVDTQLVYDHLAARGYEIAGSPDRAGLERAARLARKILGRTEGAEDAI